MANEEFGLQFGLSEKSWARLRGVLGRIESIEGDLATSVHLSLHDLRDLLEASIKHEFEPHNRKDKPDDPHFGDEGYTHTIDTLEVSVDGYVVTARMAGGAPYIEEGTTDHWVAPLGDYPLHWTEGGEDYYSMGHEVSGIEADPFMERAKENLHLETVLPRIFHGHFLAKWASAEGIDRLTGEAKSYYPTSSPWGTSTSALNAAE